jgi:hypothetical protein
MCRLLLQSRTLKITYTEKYQNAANPDGSRIYLLTNVHLKESSAKKILRTQTERNWICIHKLQVIFFSNHDRWLPLENLPFTHRKSVKGKG